MGYMQEYIDKIKTMPLQDLEKELQQLIGQFNEKFDCELVLFITDLEKNVQEVALTNADYEVLYDMLLDKTGNRVVTFLETPGGSGDAAQNIARMLDNKYNEVNFLIAGEAKSAGTILALSGDEILMTESGSLGPIDAQMTIGRSTVSAHDYISWVNDKRNEAKEEGRLNPFDAVIAAQINPGELRGVHNAYYFAIDFVKKWLPEHKFKNWDYTESRGVEVTEEYKRQRAAYIAESLTNQQYWRGHERSLKINDLKEIGLKIVNLDQDERLAEIVYRIKSICRMIFSVTPRIKLFALEDQIITKQVVGKPEAVGSPDQNNSLTEKATVARFKAQCPSCSKTYHFYIKLDDGPDIDKQEQNMGHIPYPKEGSFKCECGEIIDLTPFRTEIEAKTGKKAIINKKNKEDGHHG